MRQVDRTRCSDDDNQMQYAWIMGQRRQRIDVIPARQTRRTGALMNRAACVAHAAAEPTVVHSATIRNGHQAVLITDVELFHGMRH